MTAVMAKSRGFTSSPGPTHRDPGKSCVLVSIGLQSQGYGTHSTCSFIYQVSPTLLTHFVTLHATHFRLRVLYQFQCRRSA